MSSGRAFLGIPVRAWVGHRFWIRFITTGSVLRPLGMGGIGIGDQRQCSKLRGYCGCRCRIWKEFPPNRSGEASGLSEFPNASTGRDRIGENFTSRPNMNLGAINQEPNFPATVTSICSILFLFNPFSELLSYVLNIEPLILVMSLHSGIMRTEQEGVATSNGLRR